MRKTLPAKGRILLIESDRDIVKLIKDHLEKEGYQTITAADGETGYAMAREQHPDLILLDLMLPKMSGLEVCRRIRHESNVPIMMITTRKGELDRILGLELGADDYVTMPFSMRELLMRIKAILRRSHNHADSVEETLRFGELELDLMRYTVFIRNKPVLLSAKEFEFLKVLVKAQGKALSRELLLEKVWGMDRSMEINTRTIDQHIARLRVKLGPEAKRILTIKNVGYRFVTT